MLLAMKKIKHDAGKESSRIASLERLVRKHLSKGCLERWEEASHAQIWARTFKVEGTASSTATRGMPQCG